METLPKDELEELTDEELANLYRETLILLDRIINERKNRDKQTQKRS